MNEVEWRTTTDPQAMLAFLLDSGKLSEWKARLFAVACCRHVSDQLWVQASWPAVLATERYADRMASTEEIKAAVSALVSQLELYPGEPVYDPPYWACGQNMGQDAGRCAQYAAYASTKPFRSLGEDACEQVEKRELYSQSHFLRDIFGSLPFRSLTLPPSVRTWHEGLIQRLAEAAYQQRQLPSGHLDPERLAVLADALEEAGADAEMVEHLRRPEAVHVRGCHVVDLLTGRE